MDSSAEEIFDDHALIGALKGSKAQRNMAIGIIRKRLLPVMSFKLKDRYSVDDGFVEDCVQETLLAVSGSIHKFRGDSKLFTWILSIGVRIALSELRKRRWNESSLDQIVEDSGFDLEDDRDGTELRTEKRELLSKLNDLVEHSLTEKQRTALLGELSGAGISVIAEKLGSSRGAIYKLAHDARRALKKGLEESGFYIGEG